MTAVKKTKPGKLNVRQRKFVKNRVAGMGVGQAALRAGYASGTEGSVLLRRPEIQTALQKAMEKAGIDDDLKAQKLKDGLEATYPERRSKDGKVLIEGAPDYFTRGQYLDKVFKVSGDYAPDRQIQEQRQVIINVQMDARAIRGLQDCGVIDAEIIDDGTNGRETALLETGPGGGQAGEDRQGPQGVRQAGAADADAADHEGGVPEEDQCGEGPGQAGASEAGPPRADV